MPKLIETYQEYLDVPAELLDLIIGLPDEIIHGLGIAFPEVFHKSLYMRDETATEALSVIQSILICPKARFSSLQNLQQLFTTNPQYNGQLSHTYVLGVSSDMKRVSEELPRYVTHPYNHSNRLGIKRHTNPFEYLEIILAALEQEALEAPGYHPQLIFCLPPHIPQWTATGRNLVTLYELWELGKAIEADKYPHVTYTFLVPYMF